MTFIVDGTTGLTFNDSSTQNVTALNAANINAGTLGKARLPTGSVLQVVSYTIPNSFQTNSTSFVTTGLQASITPTSASSKILVNVDINGSHKSGGASIGDYAFYALYKFISGGSAAILRNIAIQGNISNGSNGGDIQSGTISVNYLDSPNTTTQTTYVIYTKSSGTTIYFSETPGDGQWTSSITLMEIAA